MEAKDSKREKQLALPSAEGWFAAQGWQAFPFQHEVWRHIAAGRSGLLHATTGSGKTYAVWFGLLNRVLAGEVGAGGLRLLWLTPMRALAADTARALEAPLAQLGLDWTVGVRTGDTEAAERTRQSQRLPEALVTTPESLTLLLTRPDSPALLGGIELVVVDEWHELKGNKRGVQLQLALARLRVFARQRAGDDAAAPRPGAGRGGGGLDTPPQVAESPTPPVWGLSATLGNTEHALEVLLAGAPGVMVRGAVPKEIVVDTLLPDEPGRFPWGGHLGIQMVEPVAREIETAATTLVFTNTRSQAEIWYQSLLGARPKWAGLIALHHGSLDREVREWVERGLKEGRLKAVVATSSLDLGVDFLPVERVLQIGSPKGVARLLQRAGRSGHAPGRPSRVTIVPTHTLELVEAAAARSAVAAGRVESRRAPDKPLDVLVQHLVTLALGTGFRGGEALAEIRGAWSYRGLTDEEFAWALDFVGRGGEALRAYPEYRRVVPDADGVFRVEDRRIAQRHRMSIGTIVADASMQVRMMNGRSVGSIEESFITRLRKGDAFVFGGRLLELVRIHEMTAFVQPAKRVSGVVPRWAGGKMPLSTEMADAALRELEGAIAGRFDAPEMRLARPLIELQARWSVVPTRAALVVESLRSREGRHLFVYPFAGRHAHLGLASLLAYRIGQATPSTFSIAVNDYGFELLSPVDIDWMGAWQRRSGVLLGDDDLLADVLASLNAGELALRRFREVARIAGLVFQGFPGVPRSTRQLQASSGLLYQVFRKYDAGNRLLGQAEREVLEQELDIVRLREALERMRGQRVVYRMLARPTPFAFPLMIERLREQVTTEKLSARIERMLAELEEAARSGIQDVV
ncbi:MAG TPA: ligase-associated DNA damage response DEXH box helicase [Burkholderiaceae bacterium]|nr:ligase-associated DNA damage response DEXH box helicase [Burkholderiaceae bacterium]HQR78340.1 ligase-associated DNA damage response DEXH box helicase [Burkholderiaceae bacterium]